MTAITPRDLIRLTKPGIVRGNSLAAAAGFFVASQGQVDWLLGAVMLIGLALVIASGCVTNNVIDQRIDQQMARTKKRAVAAGRVSTKHALIYGAILGLAGLAILAGHVNTAAALAALTGWILYVVVYSLGKRATRWGTELGSLSGAIPPVVGFVAVTGGLASGAYVLFLLMVLWQMPHFYAIAIRRIDDYRAAGLPVRPIVKGLEPTRIAIIGYITAYTLAVPLLSLTGYTGWIYGVAVLPLCLIWLYKALKPIQSDGKAWALDLFKFSLLVLLVFCAAASLDASFI